MDLNREALEGGARLAQVRRTKKLLMLVQVIIVLVSVLVLTVVGGQVQIKPFYFNITSFLYFVILMGLIIVVEGMFFHVLELKYLRSSSAKYYMLKSSVRRSAVIIAISAVTIVLLLTPYMADAIANYSSESGETTTTATFLNRDPLGLTTVDKIYVDSAGEAEALIVSEQNYLLYAGDMQVLRLYADKIVETSTGAWIDFPETTFGKYYIVVDSASPVEVQYTVHKTLSPTFVAFMVTFATLFIGFNGIWVAMALRIRTNYKAGAIYG